MDERLHVDPMTVASGVIPVSNHQFGVTNIDNYPMPVRGQTNDLVEPADGGVVVKTGIHTGRVYLSVELRTDAPVDVDDSWEEITEVSIDPPAPRSLSPTEALLLLGRTPEPLGLRIVALMSDLEDPSPDLNPPAAVRVVYGFTPGDVTQTTTVSTPSPAKSICWWPGRPRWPMLWSTSRCPTTGSRTTFSSPGPQELRDELG